MPTLRQSTAFVLLLVLATRLAHFASAVRSPLTYQIGPDEDYYLRFGMDVAFGSGGMVSEFAFMDPLYGYVLGAVLWVSGGSVFPAYVLQILVDVGTAFGLVLIGRELDRPRMGLCAALLYAVLGPAMAFSMALLKATWVAAVVCWWIYLGLRLLRARGILPWLGFGLYCGLAIALRANLVLLVALGVLLLPWLYHQARRPDIGGTLVRTATLLAGLVLPLAVLVARNHAIDGRWSPVPTNGGVVLHQLYNPENPQSRSGAPSFVRYGHPSEIWRGYNAEAARRAGRALSQKEADGYWRAQGREYLLAHPAQSLRNGLRKLSEFSAYTEVPNNRSYADERRFSPLLRVLPQPFGWLFALGVPGLVLLAARDRRCWVLLAPVAMGVATVAVFFAEDRFRFGIIGPFVLGSAAWLSFAWQQWRADNRRLLAVALAIPLVLGTWSVLQARRIPPTPMDWQRIATGYFKMGERVRLLQLLDEVEGDAPDAVGLHEFRGLIALADGRPALARRELEAALARRQDRHEVWHNYARSLEGTGDLDAALAAQAHAHAIAALPEYTYRIGDLLQRLGRTAEARNVFASLADRRDAGAWRSRALTRLESGPDSPGIDSGN